MPRRAKTNLQKQKMKLITTRLMKISLQVDNYIYKNIAISESEAEVLIQEVTSYTDQCSGDERSLQVIEKLIRQLQLIIQEQRELKTVNSDINAPTTTSLPANSIADLTQCYDNELNNILNKKKVALDKKIKPNSSRQNKRKFNNCMNDKDLRDNILGVGVLSVINEENDNSELFPEEDNIGETLNSLLIDAETSIDDGVNEIIDLCKTFQKSFSNLSLKDIDDEIHFDAELNSQSILVNFDCYESKEKESNTIANMKERETVNQKEVTAQLRNYRKSNPPLFNNSINNIDKTPPKVTRGRKLQNKFLPPTIKQQKENVIQNDIKNNGAIKRKCNKSYPAATETSVKKTKQNVKFTDKANIINEQKKTNSKNSTKNTARSKAKPKPVNAKPKQKVAKTSNKNYNTKEVTTISVEMDLSWVKNIKYVREVAPEEIYPANYGDSFWQNYDLPADWNKDDFL